MKPLHPICASVFLLVLLSMPSLAKAFSSSSQRLFSRSASWPPPPPEFRPKPLPVILAGGLFLFASSVRPQDRAIADELLQQAQSALRADPTVIMELGQGIEVGGVYASKSSTTTTTTTTAAAAATTGEQVTYKQLVLQFQIEGGNAWAQGVAYGIQPCSSNNNNNNHCDKNDSVQLISLEVANMDASINGTPFEIPIRQSPPKTETGSQ